MNPYVLLTIEVFREQLVAAKAVGDVDRANAYAAAIRSLMEESAARSEHEPVSRSAPLAN